MSIYELTGAIELGLIYGLVAVGVYISFRILDFPDMTVDGSFPMGAGVSAVLILGGYNPWVAALMAVAAGSAAGLVTALLNVYGRILHLLASILTMTALYSVNLRIMGAPNLSLLNEDTIFKPVGVFLTFVRLDGSHKSSVIALTLLLLIAIVIGLYSFFHTQVGLSMRATGRNKQMATAQGVYTDKMILIGLALSNGLCGLAGAVWSQSQSSADVNMGTGTIVAGLAAVIIGESFVRARSLLWILFSCIFGAILFRGVIAIALNGGAMGLEASDLNLVAAVLIASAMIFTRKTGRPA